MRKVVYILLMALVNALMVRAQERDSVDTDGGLATDINAWFVTVTPGSSPTSFFGHAAIRMQCESANLDYCFTTKSPELNNECFDITMRTVPVGLVPEETEQFRDDYRREGRGITEYKLNLSTEELRLLWKILDDEVALGLYRNIDYARNGCANSCVSYILKAIEGRNLKLDKDIDLLVNGDTRRTITMRYVEYSSWQGFLAYSLYGGVVDEKVEGVDKLIMPQDVAGVLESAGMVSSVQKVCSQNNTSEGTSGLFTPLVFAFLFLAICCVKNPYVDYAVLAFQTLVGIVICAMVFVSDAPATEWNWLVLVFNPLPVFIYRTGNMKVHIVYLAWLVCFIIFMLLMLDKLYCLAQVLIVAGIAINFCLRDKEFLTH